MMKPEYMVQKKAKHPEAMPYSALVDQAGDAFFVHAEGTRIIDVNAKACRLLGYTREELLGKTIPDVSAEFCSIRADERWKTVREGGHVTFETHLRRKDGLVLPVEITLSALRLPGVTYYLGVVRDVTARHERDRAYRHLIHSMNDAAFVVGPAGRFLEINTKASEMLGYSREQLLTMTPADIDNLLGRDTIDKILADVAAGHPRVVETEHRSGDGHTTPVEISLSATSYMDQAAVLAVVRDITHRKLVEESLLKISRRNQAIIQTIPDIVAEVDENKVYTWANRAALDFFGDDVIGREAAEYIVDPQETYAAVESLFAGETDSQNVESWQRRKDGQQRLLMWWCRVLRDSEGQVIGALSTARDITEQRREEAVRDARLRVLESAPDATVERFLQGALRALELLTASPIGFCNFMVSDGEVFTAAAWASLDEATTCPIESQGLHHVLSKAGIWADCARERRPLVYNDYHAQSHRNGLPEGHVPLTRILTVPVFRSDKIVAVFALGNKQTDYTEQDVQTVSGFVDLAWYTVARKQAEAALQESDTRNRRLFDSSPHAVLLSDPGGHFLDCNQAAIDTYGYSRDELLRMSYRDLAAPSVRARAGEHVGETLASGGTVFEWRHMRKDGSELPVEIKTAPFLSSEGKQRILATVRDLTEAKAAQAEQERLQEQLRQAAKMESIGRLAGGVAHDFNNMLAVILGHVELALEQAAGDDPLHVDLTEIRNAANHSANITQQLLAFARRQVASPMIIDLNSAVEGTLDMLRGLIGERVQLGWHPGEELGQVEMDPAQLDQVLVNLCLNARDAVSGHGRVQIATSRVTMDEAECLDREGASPGDYLALSIADDGAGMTPEAIEHMFEPFFTTKDVGEGTGLGLATVYGIVRQNNGFIEVLSGKGEGTTVTVYLPLVDAPLSDRPSSTPQAPPTAGGMETLLVVEDEPSVLRLASRILERLNYTVLAADTPHRALDLAKEHSADIALVITDVVMPEMTGWELSQRLRDVRPSIRTLYVSGYTDDVLADDDRFAEGINFLQKPFTPQQLAEAVRTVLDQVHPRR